MTDEQPTPRLDVSETTAGAPGIPAVEGEGATPEAAPKGGIGALIRKHPVAWSVAGGITAFVLLGTGALFAGAAVGARPTESAVAGPEEQPLPERTIPELEAVPVDLRTCSVDKLASNTALGKLSAIVMNAETGEVLFDRRGTKPVRIASVAKVLTAAAAIETLGADARIKTTVYEGSTPGSIVLVGRGDATLSALPDGQESVYKGAPKLQSLAEKTLAKYAEAHPGEMLTHVVLDATYWNSGDKWDSSWKRAEQTTGNQSEVTALQVDGDRADPKKATSPRSTDPIGRAGKAFIAALQAADVDGIVDPMISTSFGSAVSTTVLAEVQSQPVSALVTYMLKANDHTLAEMLARVVSKKSGMNGSAASLQQAIPGALLRWGVDIKDMTIVDGSGLSGKNTVSPEVIAEFMREVRTGGNGLGVVRDALAVAGVSGSLQNRFTGDNAVVHGDVIGKTGSITTAHTLAGVIEADDGTPFTFSFAAVGDPITADAKEALDKLVAGVFRCGDNLSNN